MMVYAPDRRCTCRASTSFGGTVPSNRKSRKGCAQDGAATTTRMVATAGEGADDASGLESGASCITVSVPKMTTTTPGMQSATPGAIGSEEPEAPGLAECAFWSDAF